MLELVREALSRNPAHRCGICAQFWGSATVESVRGFHVTVSVLPMSVSPRGHYLLQLERHLRSTVDPRIEVFLEPTADANELRKRLRGVTVE